MKINLKGYLADFNGEDLVENGKTISIKDLVCKHLYNGIGIKPEEAKEKKYAAYKIMCKIASSDICDITDEESILIKEICSKGMSVGAYGQLVELLK